VLRIAVIPMSVYVVITLQKVTHEMDLSYGMLGSLFRSGSYFSYLTVLFLPTELDI